VATVITSEANRHLALSRYVRRTLIATDAPDLLDSISRFGERLGDRPALFFETDDDLLLVSRHRGALSKIFRFALPPQVLVEALVDKARFAELAARRKLPTPATLVLREGRATSDAATKAWNRFPCIVKPSVRTRWFGATLKDQVIGLQKAIRVETRADFDALLPALEAHPNDFIVQELIEGGEERVLSYHAYVRDGQIIADFTGRKVRTTPRDYGFSACIEITDDDKVRRVGRDVLERLDFSGVVKLDFKLGPRDGRLCLLEANPRFNLWHHPGAVAGVNLPWLVYRDLLEPGVVKPQERRARPGVRWMLAALDLRAFHEHREAGELSPLSWLVDLARADVIEDLDWRDPLPSMGRLASGVRRRLPAARRTPSRAARTGSNPRRA
jgi:predicted ATP-grasp superfamily ATP-dependent carboligase